MLTNKTPLPNYRLVDDIETMISEAEDEGYSQFLDNGKLQEIKDKLETMMEEAASAKEDNTCSGCGELQEDCTCDDEEDEDSEEEST